MTCCLPPLRSAGPCGVRFPAEYAAAARGGGQSRRPARVGIVDVAAQDVAARRPHVPRPVLAPPVGVLVTRGVPAHRDDLDVLAHRGDGALEFGALIHGEPWRASGEPLASLGEPASLASHGEPWRAFGEPLASLGEPLASLGEPLGGAAGLLHLYFVAATLLSCRYSCRYSTATLQLLCRYLGATLPLPCRYSAALPLLSAATLPLQ
eukprot:gene333-biopygen11158